MLGLFRLFRGQQGPLSSSMCQHIMWPKIWLHCALWLSCAKRRCWRTCGRGPCWDRKCWCLRPCQEILQIGCPCEPAPRDLRDSVLPENQTPRWQSGGEVSCTEPPCRRAQRSPARETQRCCRRSRKGSGSGILLGNQHEWGSHTPRYFECTKTTLAVYPIN